MERNGLIYILYIISKVILLPMYIIYTQFIRIISIVNSGKDPVMKVRNFIVLA